LNFFKGFCKEISPFGANDKFCKTLKIGLSVASSIEVTNGFSMVWGGELRTLRVRNSPPPQFDFDNVVSTKTRSEASVVGRNLFPFVITH